MAQTDSRSRWGRLARWQRALILVAIAVVLVVGAAGLHTYARLEGWLSERLPPEELAARLAPYTTVSKPAGEGPFPTALLFHGCDGAADNMERWANALVDAGWVAIVIDSHTPRELLDYDKWRLVCAGQLFPGAERAGDVMTAIAEVSALRFVDEDRIALIGMSHGGWSIMELLALDGKGRIPFNLTRQPEALADRGLSGVVATILVYPWCGLASRARRGPWAHEGEVLFILAREDVIAPAYECEIVAETLQAAGKPVETVVYDNVTHGFDQVNHAPLSPLEFDGPTTERAIAEALRVMNRSAGVATHAADSNTRSSPSGG